jgi:hypothetical protein
MSLETSMSSRHLLPGRRTRSCIRSIRTNHSSYRHWNWIHQNWIHQNCHRRQSGFRQSCRNLNVQRAGRHVEHFCVPSESFGDHLMNCCRHRTMMSCRKMTMSRRKMMTSHLTSCFRRYCSNHLMSHTQRCNGGSSQPVRHSRQMPLLKER